MSLVFLKNANTTGEDGHMKPYSWSNNFDTPLILPPDSQVAYISSTMEKEKTIILTDADHLWTQIGNEQLNIPMPLYLTTPNSLAETWGDVAARVQGNEYTGVTDFMYDGQSGGLSATYNDTTEKFQLSMSQRLQPEVQDVWANNGNSLGATWTGLNQVGISVSDPPINPLGNSLILGSLPGSAPAVPPNFWNCGWTQIDLAAGGKGPGDLQDFGEDNFSLARSATGIKRSVYEANSNGDLLGGALQIRGTNNPGVPNATATSQAVPYVFGLNSVQAMQIADSQGAGEFISNASINGGFGASASVLAPNVVQVRISDRQELIVEIMNNDVLPDAGEPIDLGAWGNVDEAGNLNTGLIEVEKIEISTWLATTLNQPQNTGAEASQPYNAVGGANANKITCAIQWTTPYTFQVLAGTGFEERTGRWEGTAVAGSNYVVGTNYSNTYSVLYDSETGGTFTSGLTPEPDKTMIVPQYFGDLGLCCWTDRRNRINFRGNFDVIKCYADTPVAPYPTYDLMLKGIDAINVASSSFGFPFAYHLKTYRLNNIYPAMVELDQFEIPTPPALPITKGYNDALVTIVSGKLLGAAGNVANYQKWYPQPEDNNDVLVTFGPAGSAPDVLTGVLIGLIKEGDDGESLGSFIIPNDLRNQTFPPLAKTQETDSVQSVHIQLTNLPINGRNGVTSTKTSTIAVIHNGRASLGGVSGTKIFETYQPEKNWIDLNNAGEMTLNELRVYISDDANAPARFLNGKSDVVVMFRQKPAADRGISTQPINRFGLTPDSGVTKLKM